MQRTYSTATLTNPVEVLRKAGYAYFRDPQSGEDSYILRLTSEFYPRFHLYVKITPDEIVLNLHLDQKKPSYGNNTKHSGEYDGPIIEKEMARLDGWVRSVSR